MQDSSFSNFINFKKSILSQINNSAYGISEQEFNKILLLGKENFSVSEGLTSDELISNLLDRNEILFVYDSTLRTYKYISKDKYYVSNSVCEVELTS